MNLAAFLHRTALLNPDATALGLGHAPVATYRAFAWQVAVLAGQLTGRLGLRKGDRAAIVMANVPDYMVVKYACWHAGICAVPVNAKLHRKEFAFILENCGARVCFTDPEKAAAVAGLDDEIGTLERIVPTGGAEWAALTDGDPAPMAEVAPDDPAWLFYTSGTTGRPKGAILSHRNLVSQTMNYFADVGDIAPGDCIVHCAPASHGSGCYGIPHVARGAAQVFPESGGFDPAEMLDLLHNWPGATFFFAPTMVVRLLNHPGLAEADTSNLKLIVYGGGPMYVEDLLRGIDILGPKFVQIYGQGEAPMTITGLTRAMHEDSGHPRYRERLGSTGVARTDVEVRVVDADDNPLPAGEIGEVVCRGDVIMRGYWNNPEATASALKGGWLHTGDMGAFDEDGFLTLKDRSKDMIISGGTNIYPREIEEVLLKHPGVREASVVGRPHEDWGEEVVAFIVPGIVPGDGVGEGGDPTAQALDRLCLENIARFKRPKDYRFVDSLPKNNYGKVLKTELRALLEAEAG
ncbi:MAG: long-chain fatty acid--CoA ligase [Rhodospirillaceae bacterium]|nr:long-chain fatty acid--CoA ligase [Rhodospirillaceae bacterium]